MKKLIFLIVFACATGAVFVWYDVKTHQYFNQRYTPDITFGLQCTDNPTYRGRPLLGDQAAVTQVHAIPYIPKRHLVQWRINGLPASPTGKWCHNPKKDTDDKSVWYPDSSLFREFAVNQFSCVWITKETDGTPADYPGCVGTLDMKELTAEIRNDFRRQHVKLTAMNSNSYLHQNQEITKGATFSLPIESRQEICKKDRVCKGFSLDAFGDFPWLVDPSQPEESDGSGYFIERSRDEKITVFAPLAEGEVISETR